MLRVALVVLLLAAMTAGGAFAQIEATDCEVVVNEECKALLGPQTSERHKAIIQELKKQQEELLKLDKMRKTGVTPDDSADLKKSAPDPDKK
jgi:hypothetical protein